MCNIFSKTSKTDKELIAELKSNYEELLNYVKCLKLSDLQDVSGCLQPNLGDVLTYTGRIWNGLQSGVNIDLVTLEVEERIGLKLKEVTYEELVTLRNSNSLVPGQFYRIIDYVTKVKKELDPITGVYLYDSAEHPFDILIQALTSNKLNEKCLAIPHKNDTYFSGNNLSLWEIHYTLDNDKYTWLGGKGTIYYMKDEFNNEAPYDFKNILINKFTGIGDSYVNTAWPFDTSTPYIEGVMLFNIFNYFNSIVKGDWLEETGFNYKKYLSTQTLGEDLIIQTDKLYVVEDFCGKPNIFAREVTPTYHYTFSEIVNNNITDLSLTESVSQNKIIYNDITNVAPSLVIIKTSNQQQITNNIFTNCTNTVISNCINSNYYNCNKAVVNNSNKFVGSIQESYINNMIDITCESIEYSLIDLITFSDIKKIKYCFIISLICVTAPRGLGSEHDWEFLNLFDIHDCTVFNSINKNHVGEELYIWPEFGYPYRITLVYANGHKLWGFDISNGTLIDMTNLS